MRAGVLREYGETPEFADFEEPRPAEGQVVVEVVAAALHHLDLHKATGTFYMGPPPLPSVVGTDGVGRLADGRRVYLDATVPPYGSMAEKALVPDAALFEIAEGADDATAAALGNTGLGAWLALAWRADLNPGETVLGIDFRPANGLLYGITNQNRLLTINPSTGAATLVAALTADPTDTTNPFTAPATPAISRSARSRPSTSRCRRRPSALSPSTCAASRSPTRRSRSAARVTSASQSMSPTATSSSTSSAFRSPTSPRPGSASVRRPPTRSSCLTRPQPAWKGETGSLRRRHR